MPELEFERSLSQPGTRVRSQHDSGLVGESTGRTRDDGDGLMVQVRFPGHQSRFEMAEDLEPADTELDDREQVLAGKFARASHLRKRLTSVQLSGQLSEMIYSLDTTDTQFMPHQFKPLLALLDSPSKGVLIADEVGLGKTIEAGLIWTELRFRTHATRLLVVCPAVLTDKWKQELYRRFGTAAQVMTARELLQHLQRGEAAPKVPAIICSLQGIRPPTDATDEDSTSSSAVVRLARHLNEAQSQTLFDLVVIDEAHYLRNHQTSSAFLGQLLRPVAEYFVLLSATPVNNRSTDLFNLVSLVDPDQFRFESEFENVLGANRPLVRLANQLKRPEASIGMVREALDEAELHWLFRNSESLKLFKESLGERDDTEVLAPEERVAMNHRLDRVNLLGQVIVRSRKREVLENRVERKVQNFSVPMTTAEEDFYQRVTEAVISYGLLNGGVQGFLLATPQRQMSSCMFAAASRWLGSGGEWSEAEAEAFAYDAFGEAIEPNDLTSVSGYVARALAGHVDLKALRVNDSKYEQLEALLKEYVRDYPQEKVIVFSYFRDTLGYLKERLESVGISALVVMGGDDKQARIDEFHRSDRYNVLLASEVAAEGVDLQFMRFLVNYDLPWNPMRVEQRIGRIDRIGQQAQAISIANMVYQDTIDDRILTRLFEKLKLFEDALGCTEDVLQDGISLLTRDLLSGHLTPDQQEQRIDQARAVMEQNRRSMAEIQEHEADFVGLGEFVRNKVSHARDTQRRITDRDLQLHICEYLEENAPGYAMLMDPGGATGSIRLGADATSRLIRFRESRQLPRSKLESGGDCDVVIRNHVNRGEHPAKYELINQYHPLVRMMADHESRSQHRDLVVAVEVELAELGLDIPPGDYAFAAEIWQFEGARREETIRAFFVPVRNGEPIGGETGFDLVNGLRSQTRDWVDIGPCLPDKTAAADLLESTKAALVRQFREARRVFQAENADRIRIQRESLARHLQRRIGKLEAAMQLVAASHRANYQRMAEGQIRDLRQKHEVAVAGLDQREQPSVTRGGLISGFVRIRG
ncbi:DEAD/DEAH box helicase [Xanthomonas arboricola]|uniref:DEAD/DEAH box helicase n=1 Tax=Xanthomonas arboricola TaxID=56448 RepID=UPI000A489EE2|nr:SNF2-related protein [Xanthomonas arboricola]